MKVLIADDEATSLAIIQGLLKKENCEPIAVDNGQKALDVLLSKSAPELAILDWMMPGMDGIDVCKKVHEVKSDKRPYIIMLTSKDGKADMANALDSGADDYMIKPCDPIEFRARLNVGKRSVLLRNKIEKQKNDLQKLIEDKEHLLNELEEDLRVAGSVQRQLLPKNNSDGMGVEIVAKSIPCNALGGDMCDFHKLDENRTIALILDVAGHGVSSALIAAFAKASFTRIRDITNSPGEILNLLNEEILNVTPSALFLTAFILIYDKSTNIMTYSGAGHIPQLYYNKQKNVIEQLRSDGVPVGMLPDQIFEDEQITISDGDNIILFTDGFTETFNSDQVMFGKKRMEDIFLKLKNDSCDNIVSGIINDVNKFRGHAINDDDICILAIKK